MTPVATRAGGLAASPIRRMAVGAPDGTVSLALGEPGWPVPDAARRALAATASQDGPMPYGPNTSSLDLVTEVADLHSAAHGIPAVAPDQVMVTSGSQAGLFALFSAHVEVGSTVLVPDPGFVSYRSLAHLCQARAVGYGLGARGELDAGRVVAALDAHADVSLVVLNHPGNPTGGMASAGDLAAVAETCARRGVVLVSDEVYRELYVGDRPAGLHEVAGVDAGVVLGSVSKAFGAPGLRVGWAVGPPELLTPARILHNAMNTAPARPSQAAAAALLGDADAVLAQAREHVRLRWETLARVAPALLGWADDHTTCPVGSGSDHTTCPVGSGSDHTTCPVTRAGFYLWLPLPAGIPPEESTDFALRVRDTSRVTTVPGEAFGPAGAGHLRASLGGPLDELEEGLARLAPWWKA